MTSLSREERIELLEDCQCPLCRTRYTEFSDLVECLRDHDDEGIDAAQDYLERAYELMMLEEAGDLLRDAGE